MKTFNKILALAFVAGVMASCADDLNTEYLGYYVTKEQKEHLLEINPSMAQAGVTGCFANFTLCENVYEEHFDFGYPSIMMGMDLQTEDLACKYSGYNWHMDWEGYTSPNSTSEPAGMMWYTMYNQIFTANALISTISDDTDVPELMFYLANGYALRAFDYYNLICTFQFNYEGHEAAPGVPVITDLNQEEAAANGMGRGTVADVYEQIMTDLNKAIELFDKSGLQPQSVISSKPKRMISLASAYGLRARVKLTMHDYAGAAADAQAAIDNFSGRPYSKAEVSVPAFTNLDDASWMWGIAIAETDRVVTTGIVNFPSFMCSFAYGYVNYGAWKYCGYGLYQQIPAGDVRKGWFLDDNYQSDHIDAVWQAYLDQYIGNPNYNGQDNTNCIFPQTNVKYDTYNHVLNQSTNASDIPLMRIEEMYLTKAEGLAMSGNPAEGKKVLEAFVKAYRNNNYVCLGDTPEDVQNACLTQRRIEFWGEGLAFFDVMRLNRGVDRRGCRFPLVFQYNIQPGDPVLIYCIPQAEITANAKIDKDDNNEESNDRPTPVQ